MQKTASCSFQNLRGCIVRYQPKKTLVLVYLVSFQLCSVLGGNTPRALNLDLFKPVPAPHAIDLTFSHNYSAALLSRDENGSFGRVGALNLFHARQKVECPPGYPVPCPGTRCCPLGTKCCEADCCPDGSTCRVDLGGCCPYSAETCGGKFCAAPGSVCCRSYLCKPGYVCNTQGEEGCCLPDELKCNGCPKGFICADTKGYCSSTSTSAGTITTTHSSTAISILFSTTTSLGAKTSGSSSTSCPELKLNKRQQLFPTECEEECLDGEVLPVLKFKYVRGQTDELIESMCKGMYEKNSRQTIDAEKLTWGGAKDPMYKQRRRDAKCDGFCREVNEYLTDEMFQECDEYPPASTKECGLNANRKYIHWRQNSGTQSHIIRIFASKTRCNLQDSDRFIIRIEGGCRYLNLKRQASETLSAASNTPSTMSLAGSDITLRNSGDLGGSNTSQYIELQLGDLTKGRYEIKVDLSEEITELYVVDGEGVEYTSISSPSGSTLLSFDLDSDLSTGASLIAVTQKQINVTYTATMSNISTSTTSSAAAAASTSESSADSLCGASVIRSLPWILAAVGAVMWV